MIYEVTAPPSRQEGLISPRVYSYSIADIPTYFEHPTFVVADLSPIVLGGDNSCQRFSRNQSCWMYRHLLSRSPAFLAYAAVWQAWSGVSIHCHDGNQDGRSTVRHESDLIT